MFLPPRFVPMEPIRASTSIEPEFSESPTRWLVASARSSKIMPVKESRHKVRDVNVRMLRGGSGPPLLFLHGANGLPVWLPVFDLLSKQFEVFVPEHPGFGTVGQPGLDAQHRRSRDVLPRFPRRARAARGPSRRPVARRLGRRRGRGAQLLADQDADAARARRHPRQGPAERRQLHLGARGGGPQPLSRPGHRRSDPGDAADPTSRPTSC